MINSWNMSSPSTDYIIVNRSLLDWEWYADLPVRVLFQHLLLIVNWKAGTFQGTDILPGQVPTSVHGLSKETGLSVQQVKTAISKLKSTGEITSASTSKFTVVTVVNWAKWQGVQPALQPRNNQRSTTDQPRINHGSTTIEEGKKLRREEHPSDVRRKAPDPRIDRLIAYLTERNGGALDGSVAHNRQACHTMLLRLAKQYPNHDPEVSVRRTIDIGKQDGWHGPKLTSFGYLVQHGVKIIQEYTTNGKSASQLSEADKLSAALAIAESRRQAVAADADTDGHADGGW